MPCFPITPQTEMIETIAKWVEAKEFDADYCQMESEHSTLSAAVSACATGVRAFTATSSQGLLLMHEMLHVASGMRLPIVMANVSRGISAPITLWSDHNDFYSAKSAGWVMLACENSQEALDFVPIAFKLAEHERVLTPALVNLDGFILSYTREKTDIPEQNVVDGFLPAFKPAYSLADAEKPVNLGSPVMNEYQEFKAQQGLAMKNARIVLKNLFKEWSEKTGRSYDLLECFECEDAERVVVGIGSNMATAKTAVEQLRAQGEKVGVCRLRAYRPFPFDDLKQALSEKKGVAVFDQNFSPGAGGALFHEVRSCLYDCEEKPLVDGVIGGLGGKNVTVKNFESIFEQLKKHVASKEESVYWI
ncbi:pyruvate ferredoxin oxidoreductase [Candidatus Micrarchaeota archaeon]|nr:pyruvate ferredoxin oxidoreductase [Candidatus Micrarchaeota archaeon]